MQSLDMASDTEIARFVLYGRLRNPRKHFEMFAQYGQEIAQRASLPRKYMYKSYMRLSFSDVYAAFLTKCKCKSKHFVYLF